MFHMELGLYIYSPGCPMSVFVTSNSAVSWDRTHGEIHAAMLTMATRLARLAFFGTNNTPVYGDGEKIAVADPCQLLSEKK